MVNGDGIFKYNLSLLSCSYLCLLVLQHSFPVAEGLRTHVTLNWWSHGSSWVLKITRELGEVAGNFASLYSLSSFGVLRWNLIVLRCFAARFDHPFGICDEIRPSLGVCNEIRLPLGICSEIRLPPNGLRWDSTIRCSLLVSFQKKKNQTQD
jgi:hypothetical protein